MADIAGIERVLNVNPSSFNASDSCCFPFVAVDAKHLARAPGSIPGSAPSLQRSPKERKVKMKRDQFTFYRSYYEALNELPEKERAKVLFALLAYALDEEEPNELSGVCSACFKLIRPTLDSGRIKAANRKNKTKTNEEQNRKEKEGEKEGEKEVEREIEIESEYDSSTPNPSYDLTDDELREIRQEQAETEKAARRVGLPVSALADQDCMDSLRAEHGANNLLKAIDKLQGAPEKSRNWRYVGGILRKEKAAGYTWAEKSAENGGGMDTTNPFLQMARELRESEQR